MALVLNTGLKCVGRHLTLVVYGFLLSWFKHSLLFYLGYTEGCYPGENVFLHRCLGISIEECLHLLFLD